MREVKDTKDICKIEDVEERVYHSFRVYRRLPFDAPKDYACYLGRFIKTDVNDIQEHERFIGRDIALAEEVGVEWWHDMPVDIEDKTLICFRCGAPAGTAGHWSGVRSWKIVAAEFHIHRNTAKNRWNTAMKAIFEYVCRLNCA